MLTFQDSRQALCRTPSEVEGFPQIETICHTNRSVEELEAFGWKFNDPEIYHDEKQPNGHRLLTTILQHPPGPDIAATEAAWLKIAKAWLKLAKTTHPSHRMKFRRSPEAKEEECFQVLFSMHQLERVGKLKTVKDQRDGVALIVVTSFKINLK
ncbi:hypothetical protein F66182_6884 [Fusarium sp. NRRL 66182]|nr:hypothetical protein F66182_6884 [Fusarium sp. NRRL 66182]